MVQLHPDEPGQELPNVGRALGRSQVDERDAVVQEFGEVHAHVAAA